MILAYQQSLVKLHTFIWVKLDEKVEEEELAQTNCVKSIVNNQIVYVSEFLAVGKLFKSVAYNWFLCM